MRFDEPVIKVKGDPQKRGLIICSAERKKDESSEEIEKPFMRFTELKARAIVPLQDVLI